MSKTPKTAPELERYVINELRKCAACASISAITVAEIQGAGWEVSHINVPGGAVPRVCLDLCADAVKTLRAQYDLVTEIEPDEL